MPDEDVITQDGGPEPATETDTTTDAAVEAPEASAESVAFTPEDLAEGLGTRYAERFAAHHDPKTAMAEYGRSVEHLQSAFTRISQGGDPTPEDIAAAEALGIQLPEAQEEPDEDVQPLWGAPWADPSNYDEFQQLAQTRPDKCMAFIDRQPNGVIDEDTRQAVLNYWAEHDRAGAMAYVAQHAHDQATTEAKAYADEMREKILAELQPLHTKHAQDYEAGLYAKIDALSVRAVNEIPDFERFQPAVEKLLKERVDYDPTYLSRLLELSVDQQLQEIRDLTGVAMIRGIPEAQAEADAEAEAAEAAKVSAGSERGSGAAATPGTTSAQSEMKKKFTSDIKKALENPA